MLASIFFILFSFSQDISPTIEVLARDDRDLYSAPLGHDVLLVESKDQALYRDSTDLLTFVSNSNASGGSNRIRFLQFRGVGEASQYENTPTHSISYLVDGVDVTGVVAHWPLLDVESVRVEKQPASVLYGGQAVGGVVETSLSHSRSSMKTRATVDSRLGHGGDVSVPLADHRVSLHYNNDAGYMHNTLLDESGNSRREVYGSFVSDWVRNDRWVFQSSVLLAHFNNRYDVWSLTDDFKTSSDRPGKDNLNMIGGAIQSTYRLSSALSLHLWSSLLASKSLYSYDADWSNNIYWNTVPGWNANYDYYDEFLRHRRQWQNRLSLQISDFVVGVHVQNISEDSDTNGFKNGLQRSKVVGHFQQFATAIHAGYTKDFGSRTFWNISARTDSIETEYKDHQSIDENFRDPQFAFSTQLDYSFNESNAVFSTLRKGYKNPIINIDPDTPQVDRRVGSEQALHLEIGHRFQRAGTGFTHSLFARQGMDQQVRVSRQIDVNDPSSFVYYYDNAAKTVYAGYEIGAFHKFARGAEGRVSLGFLNARFKDYIFDGQVLTDRHLAHAPKNTWAVQWVEPIGTYLSVIAQGEGKSAYYFSNNHGMKNLSYALAHVALRYAKGAHEVDFGVRNFLDKEYGIRAFYFANEPPDFLEKLYVQKGPPQTLYLNYRWTL